MAKASLDIEASRLSDDRKALAEQFVPLAYKIARRFARRTGADEEDALSVAEEALVHAARTWKPEVGSFMTHAFAAIQLRVSSGDRTNEYRFMIGTQADRTSPSKRRDGLPSVHRVGEDGFTWIRDGSIGSNPSSRLRRWERNVLDESLLTEALDMLDDRARTIVELRIARGMNLHQVGALVGLTNERVRQIVMESVNQIRVRHGMPAIKRLPSKRRAKKVNRKHERRAICEAG